MGARLGAVLDMLARIGEYAYESLLLPPLDSLADEADDELPESPTHGRLFDQPDLIR
jgi:hypothetical protein